MLCTDLKLCGDHARLLLSIDASATCGFLALMLLLLS